MDAKKKTDLTEEHSFFPSGEWEGFYTYNYGSAGAKHPMSFILKFSQGIVKGVGNDDIGTFTWKGAYDTKEMTCHMTKFYTNRSHTVFYNGLVDENGIWGQWRIHAMGTGGFHIWPKGHKIGQSIFASQEEPVKETVEKEKVEKIKVE